MLDGGLVFAVGGRSNCAELFVRVDDLGMVVWCAWMIKCVSKMGWWQTIRAKEL